MMGLRKTVNLKNITDINMFKSGSNVPCARFDCIYVIHITSHSQYPTHISRTQIEITSVGKLKKMRKTFRRTLDFNFGRTALLKSCSEHAAKVTTAGDQHCPVSCKLPVSDNDGYVTECAVFLELLQSTEHFVCV